MLQAVTVVSAMLFLCAESGAGEFSIKPSIILREEYDDNIYLTKDNKESDYITRVLPSLNMKYSAPLWDWSLDYTLNWWYYAKLRQGKDSHYARLVSQIKVIQNFLYFDVHDNYESVVLNTRAASTESNLLQNRSDTNNLSVSPYIKYQADPFVVSTGYRYNNIWYREASGIKRQMHTGFVTGEYKISPVLTLQTGAEYTADRPEEPEPDNNRVSVFAGAIYKISPKLKFDGTLGCRWINFDELDDTTRPLYNVGFIYLLSKQGQIELRAKSTIVQSPEDGLYDSRIEEVVVRYGEAVSVNGSIFHRYDIYLEEDRKDEAYGVIAGLEYRPDQRLTFSIKGGYERDKYLPDDDKRNIYTAFLGVDYKLTAKATLGLTYYYNKSDGDRRADNYTDNVVGLQLKIEI